MPTVKFSEALHCAVAWFGLGVQEDGQDKLSHAFPCVIDTGFNRYLILNSWHLYNIDPGLIIKNWKSSSHNQSDTLMVNRYYPESGSNYSLYKADLYGYPETDGPFSRAPEVEPVLLCRGIRIIIVSNQNPKHADRPPLLGMAALNSFYGHLTVDYRLHRCSLDAVSASDRVSLG